MLMGPDSNKTFKPDLKSHAGQVVFENVKRKTDWKKCDEGKVDHGHFQQIKLNNFNVSLWDERIEILYHVYPILTATGDF